jgi:hypothetical protein
MMTEGAGCCIAVLGMGRSGTSAIAGALRLMHVDLGSNLIDPDELNPTGYFEDASVITINRSLLCAIQSYEGDFKCLDHVDWNAPSIIGHRQPITEVLYREFRHSALFAIKDPRLCRVWPVWARAVADAGWSLRYILPLRHPIEVVQSLQSLGTSTNYGLLWWASHTLDAEWHSRGAPRCIVAYRELLENPRTTMDQIGAALTLVWPASPEEAEGALNAFLDRSLRHFSDAAQAEREEADQEILGLVESVYTAMLGGGEVTQMDALRAAFADLARRYAGWRSPRARSSSPFKTSKDGW